MKNSDTAPLGSAQRVRLAASIGLLALFGMHGALAFDGNPANAIFVDGAGGSNANPGTITQPKQTIAAGIGAATLGKSVYVAKGTYAESFSMQSGISVYGGYDRADNWSHSFNNITTISPGAAGVIFDAVSGETHLEGFHITATAAAAGGSSYAVRINNSSGPVMIRYNTLSSGVGGSGGNGGSGTSMGTANGGGGGSPGAGDGNVTANGGSGGSSTCSAAGGAGGAGGFGPANGIAGMSGANNSASGGFGGSSDAPGEAGGPGSPGANGMAGANKSRATTLVGSASPLLGTYSPPSTPAQATNGGNGSGGGGGGGGGGQHGQFVIDGTGNGGGGGGAGGCGGGGGFSGDNGGGSFPVLVVGSTATIASNALVIAVGGAGGTGGPGGSGGIHGAQGNGNTVAVGEVGAGGIGAPGGNGGKGGDGAGGNGGPSIGILSTGGALVTTGTNRYTRPPSGAGGGAAPLTNSANNGVSGVVQNAYPANAADPAPAALDVTNRTAPMGFTGSSTLLIPVSLAPVTDSGVSVNFQTFDGTAAAGVHYVATSGTLTFEPWDTTQFIRVTLIGVSTTPKDFTVTLSSPNGASIVHATATATIDYGIDVIFSDNFE